MLNNSWISKIVFNVFGRQKVKRCYWNVPTILRRQISSFQQLRWSLYSDYTPFQKYRVTPYKLGRIHIFIKTQNLKKNMDDPRSIADKWLHLTTAKPKQYHLRGMNDNRISIAHKERMAYGDQKTNDFFSEKIRKTEKWHW